MNLLAPFNSFILVAECLNFSEAARRLNVPRATISARINELEKQLGVRLFLRNTRHVSLTPEGEQYLLACKTALNTLEAAGAQFTQAATLAGDIRLSVPASLPNAHFLSLLQSFHHKYPLIRIELVSKDDVLDLAEHRIDIAIRGKDPVNTELIARPLPPAEMLLVASPEWLAKHAPVSEWHNVELHDPLGLSPFSGQNPAIRSSNLEQSLSLCLSGTGIALLPLPLCQSSLQSSALKAVPPPVPLPSLPLFLIYQQRRLLPQRVKVLIDFLLSAMRP
ncbi:LysR family transcriptional regulator [Photobacterium sp. 2_MG-2023]|uniref:LysR family transcriptional regulator n=1 Tax=Photobacterium sp. 2_MG-2023 TaxID=3062663 RepID=UPI0026E31FA9|nr:LysR family transcriptional regulator [Photobacterium sp. 2_MG-2023]MDO6583758.1 LysR family transcriptional regulator [Photobacterium sp. 2_MG-2023]